MIDRGVQHPRRIAAFANLNGAQLVYILDLVAEGSWRSVCAAELEVRPQIIDLLGGRIVGLMLCG